MNKDAANLKGIGVLLIIFGIIYVLFGTFALAGVVTNQLPAHENQEIEIVVLAYVIGILPILGGIACQKAKIGLVLVITLVLAILSIVAMIWLYTTHNTISAFDGIGCGLGLGSFIYALRAKASM